MHRFSLLAPMSVLAALTMALTCVPPASAAPVHARAAQVAAPAAGTFTRLPPTRILDTRIRLAAPGSIGRHGTVALHVLGVAGVPTSGVAAVALTVTATRPGGPGYLTVYPDGVARPNASNLNFVAGQNVANMAIVPVGVNGNIRLFNGAGNDVDMLADIVGYYTAGTASVAGSFQSLTAQRLLDTRSGGSATRVLPYTAVPVRVAGIGGVPVGAASVVVNLTSTRAALSGYLTATADGAARPPVSSVNFSAGQNVANLAVVPIGANGRISIFNGSGGSGDVLVDVVGYYVAGTPTALGSFRSVEQRRILDTRTGVGASGPLANDATVPLQVMGSAGVPAAGVSSVVLNLTVASPSSAGYLTAYADGSALPNTSNLNFATRATTAALVTVPVGADGIVRVYNGGGATNVIADIVGYYVGNNAQPCNLVPRDPSGDSVTRWNPVVQCVLGMLGAQSAGNVADVDTVIRYESSGNPAAVNLWDSNAKAGHPSAGLVQVIQPTFDYYRSALLPANLYDPAANLYAGMHYAIATYGSIHNIPGVVSLRNGGPYRGYVVRN